MADVTEDGVVFTFAKAWNRLDPEEYLALLAPEARYASEWVFDEPIDASAISDYLRNKIRAVRAHSLNDPNARVRMEVGRIAHGEADRPCAFITQGHGDIVQAAVLFEISDGRVPRYDLCIPQLVGAVQSGIFPF